MREGGTVVDIRESRAYKFAEYAAAPNPKIGKYVRRQAEKWLAIANGEVDGAFVDEKRYNKVCRLLRLMVHPDLGCSMLDGLEDYALWFIVAVFCTRERLADGATRQYYATGLLEIARKNYKTFTAAAIFIIGMLMLPRFSRLFSVAPDLKLSSELKVAINKIIQSSPLLLKHFKVMRSEVR